MLSCISINNQECKVRPQTVNVNSKGPVFFPFSIKKSKCSGSCNNINNPHAKLCVSDVVKHLNAKVFNLMSRTNETRHIEWHETCKRKCRLDASILNNNQRWNDDKYRCECKGLIDKGISDKDSIWNPCNCEWECDKSCDIGEYLDYENCKCRKKLDDKLVQECTKNVGEVKLVKITSTENGNKHKRSWIGTYFIHFHWYLKNMLLMLSLVPVVKQPFSKLINGGSQTNRDQKSNLLFLQRHDQSQTFWLKLVKNRQKALQRD